MENIRLKSSFLFFISFFFNRRAKICLHHERMEFMELKKLETQEEGWHADWQGTGEGTLLSRAKGRRAQRRAEKMVQIWVNVSVGERRWKNSYLLVSNFSVK